MVADAEKYKNEDEAQKQRIAAKNALESYAYNMKTTMEDDKLKDKIPEDDRKTCIDKCNEVVDWLDKNHVSEDTDSNKPHTSGFCCREMTNACNFNLFNSLCLLFTFKMSSYI